MTDPIDTGDFVLHRPTGETWVVAFVEGEHLYWCGWPEGRASISDFELREKATPEQRRQVLFNMCCLAPGDPRRRYARRLAQAVVEDSDD